MLPGQPAIEFEMLDVEGNVKHLADFRGKVIYIDSVSYTHLSRKAILTLENGEKVDLSVKKGTISNVNSTVSNNNANQLLTYRKVEEVSSTPHINTVAIPRGGEYQLILSDGTRIWMNAESLLRRCV